MGGAVARSVAAITSLGTSELYQEKPFQGVTDEDRPTAGGGSPLRFMPFSSAVLPATKETLGQASGSPAPHDREYGPEVDKQEQAIKDAQQKSADDTAAAAADLEARIETAQEARQVRVRAGAVASRLGVSGKRRASDTFLGGPVGGGL